MALATESRGPPKEASLKTTMYLPDALCSGPASTGETGLCVWSEQAASATSEKRMTEVRFIGSTPWGGGRGAVRRWTARSAGAAGLIPETGRRPWRNHG